MAINLTAPQMGNTATYFCDTNNDGTIPSMTQVDGVNVAAAFEIQSTGGAFLPPRMTTAQINALTPVSDGMYVYNTDLASPVIRTNNAWSPFGIIGLTKTVTLTRTNIQGMFAAPVILLAAPGAGLSIVVKRVTAVNNFNTTAFADGGAVVIQYGNTVEGGGQTATTTNIPAAFVISGASAIVSIAGEVTTTAVTTATTNTAIYASNATGAFTGGNAASTIVLTIEYTIVTTP